MVSDVRDRALSEASFADLIGSLANDIAILVKSEVELAKKELQLATRKFVVGASLIAAGLLFLFYGLFFLLFAAIFGLGEALPTWASSLIIGGGIFVLGILLIVPALIKISGVDVAPRTNKTLRENMLWLAQKRP